MDKTLTNKQRNMYEANNTCKHCKPLARLGVSESGMADAQKGISPWVSQDAGMGGIIWKETWYWSQATDRHACKQYL